MLAPIFKKITIKLKKFRQITIYLKKEDTMEVPIWWIELMHKPSQFWAWPLALVISIITVIIFWDRKK